MDSAATISIIQCVFNSPRVYQSFQTTWEIQDWHIFAPVLKKLLNYVMLAKLVFWLLSMLVKWPQRICTYACLHISKDISQSLCIWSDRSRNCGTFRAERTWDMVRAVANWGLEMVSASFC